MEGRCPDTYYCSNGSQPYSDIKPSLLLIPAYASLITSSLSALGAALIVLAYCAFKDLRKGTAQTIITLLALADLGSAVAGIFGASLFIRYFNLDEKSEEECYIFDTVCQIQGFVGMWAYQCSLIWTSVLATHFLLITIFHHSTWTDKLLPLYNIIAWIVPLAIALSLLALDEIGYNHFSTWTCFLRSTSRKSCNYLIAGVWWIPEGLATTMMLFGYIFALVYIACKKTNQLHATQRINRRMLTIVLAYIILRIPDALQSLSAAFNLNEPCLKRQYQSFGYVTVTMQATADSSQGWINCVLYIFLSSKVRRRMFVLPFGTICKRYKQHTQHARTSEVTSLLGSTQNTPSTLRRAHENGDTYLSFPTEFSTTVQATTTSCPESLSRIPEIQ